MECSDRSWREQKVQWAQNKLLCISCHANGYRITRRGNGLEDFTCAEESCGKVAGREMFHKKDLSNLQQRDGTQIYCLECREWRRNRKPIVEAQEFRLADRPNIA